METEINVPDDNKRSLHRFLKVAIALIVSMTIVFAVVAVSPNSRRDRAVNECDPQLVSVQARHDFGHVASGEVLTHRFPIRNLTGGPVFLALGPKSCSCITPRLHPRSLPPRGEGTLEFIINATNRQSAEVEAYVMLIATPRTEVAGGTVSTEQKLPIRVSAKVSKDRGLVPGSVDFGNVRRRGAAVQKSFHFVCRRELEHDIHITPDDTKGFLTIELSSSPRVTDETLVYDGSVIFDPANVGIETEVLSTSVGFSLRSDGRERRFSLGIDGVIANDVTAKPDVLYWGSNNLNQRRTFLLESFDNSAIKVESVECSIKRIKWEILDDSSVRPQIIVKCSESNPIAKIVRGNLSVRVSYGDGDEGTVVLPIIIF